MNKRTKACAIPKEVKEKVYKRDNERCLICGRWVMPSLACAHFIGRAQGGLGIEENILTLCEGDHFMYDNGIIDREKYKQYFRDYLKSKYENWNEEDLVYDKWKGVFDADTNRT